MLKRMREFLNGMEKFTNDDAFKETMNFIITDIIFYPNEIKYQKTKRNKL